MPSVTRIRRTSIEVSGELAKARGLLATADEGGYLHAKCSAIADACLWVLGERAAAPVTGGVMEPTDDALIAEMERGEALEDERRHGAGGDPVAPGAAAHLLSWVLMDVDTESPL